MIASCDNCGAIIHRRPSTLRKKENTFCCRECQSEFRRLKTKKREEAGHEKTHTSDK